MKPTCHKCRSTALVRDDYGVGDDIQKAVKYLACGWRIARPRAAAPKPSADQKLACDPRHNYAMVPCTRIGCTGRVRASTTNRLCRSCNTKLTMWQSTKRTMPAPFVQLDDGRWIDNPARHGRAAA